MIKIKKILKKRIAKIVIATSLLMGMFGMMAFGNTEYITNKYRLGQTVENISKQQVSYNTNYCSQISDNTGVQFNSLNISHKVYSADGSTVIATGPSIKMGVRTSKAPYNRSGYENIVLSTTYDKYSQYTSWSVAWQWNQQAAK